MSDVTITQSRCNNGPWEVRCKASSGHRSDFMGDLLGAGLILRARKDAWQQAMWWARWHADEHERVRCAGCHHSPEVPPITILDGDTVKVGSRVFLRDGMSWREAQR